jgi:hypothetical protein
MNHRPSLQLLTLPGMASVFVVPLVVMAVSLHQVRGVLQHQAKRIETTAASTLRH